jgi:UDPglucose 6-dehydrogenase
MSNSAQRPPIAVIGAGYVGLVTAAGFAELGSEVWCVDIDAKRIERLRAGDVPIYEPGLEKLLADNAARLHFGTDLGKALANARLLFVAVGTPATYSGDADLSAVHAVVAAMPPSDEHALVMKSTVPCGTGAGLRRSFAEHGKERLGYVSCPEFLREGTAVKDFMHPDRVVVGSDDGDWAADAVEELYAPLQAPIVRMDVASAEMVKLASNAFLATKISFINEIANVCEETGADVVEVARGMGLDDRIGSKFLQAGIGYGGSCLAPEETVLARWHGRTMLLTFEQLWERVGDSCTRIEGADALRAFGAGLETEVLEPEGLEVLSWLRDEPAPTYMPVMALTRRPYEGKMLSVATKMGRRVCTTPDHPWLVRDRPSGRSVVKLAFELTSDDFVPLAGPHSELAHGGSLEYPIDSAIEEAGLQCSDVVVRLPRAHIDELMSRPVQQRRVVFDHPRGFAARCSDVRSSGAMRLDEVARADLPLREAMLGPARNGTYLPAAITMDEAFWRVVGLYLAEGYAVREASNTSRIHWCFDPTKEEHLVGEVVTFWARHGVRARAARRATTHQVTVQARLVGAFWLGVLGLGRNSYAQRLPDLAWSLPPAEKWALLGGLWEGDGWWSLVNGGPSVVLELGTVSDELADGVLRLLADLGIYASRRIARPSKSTKHTHFIRISGADQIERALELVPQRDRAGVLASVARQRKRIAPSGFQRHEGGRAWVRITDLRSERHAGHVYSLEVPRSHTVVTSGGVITGNCFPKDVDALKQLAGNSGYHFQLLTAVIEVNELQKRRVLAKLHKHLGELPGKRVALLGLAFKPDTDDMREASSLVLAARLNADGAQVVAYDPVAEARAREVVSGITFARSALQALEGADAAILVTEWQEFIELDWRNVASMMSGKLVVDGRNALDADAVRAAGLIYEGIGRAAGARGRASAGEAAVAAGSSS